MTTDRLWRIAAASLLLLAASCTPTASETDHRLSFVSARAVGLSAPDSKLRKSGAKRSLELQRGSGGQIVGCIAHLEGFTGFTVFIDSGEIQVDDAIRTRIGR